MTLHLPFAPVNLIFGQKTEENFEIIVVDPFPDVEQFIRTEIKDNRLKFFLDPGEGQSYALTLLFGEYGSATR